jgi:hypothetical protein
MMKRAGIRKGMPERKLGRAAFEARYRSAFVDAAWEAYSAGRKAPHTRRAGPGFANPDYEIAVEWLATQEELRQAQAATTIRGRPRKYC